LVARGRIRFAFGCTGVAFGGTERSEAERGRSSLHGLLGEEIVEPSAAKRSEAVLYYRVCFVRTCWTLFHMLLSIS